MLQVNQIFFYDRITATGGAYNDNAYLASHTFVHGCLQNEKCVYVNIGYLQPGTCINTVCDC